MERRGFFGRNINIIQQTLLDHAIELEDDIRIESKEQSYKLGILAAFPSMKLYKALFREEEEEFVEEIPNEEELEDIIKLINRMDKADSGDID